MKRFLIFPALFPPLALVVYVTPLLVTEGVPEVDLLFTLLGLAYVFVLVPACVAAGTDLFLSVKRFHAVATVAVAVAMAHLVARHVGHPMNPGEIILVTLTGAIPAAVCSWLSGMNREMVGE